MAKKTKGMKIESELVKLTGLKRKPKEDLAVWITRLVKAGLNLDEDELDGMADATYDYCNQVADLLDEEEPVLDFEGNAIIEPEPEEETEEEEEEPEEEEELGELIEDEPKIKDVAPKAKKKAKKSSKVKRRTKQRSMSGEMTSKTEAYREFLLQSDYTKERKELIAEGLEAGFGPNPHSLSGIIYHTKSTIQMLKTMMGVEIPDPSTKAGAKQVASAVKKASAAKPEPDPEPAAKKTAKKVGRKKAAKKEKKEAPKRVSRRRRAVEA